jgi:hypothetical protein
MRNGAGSPPSSWRSGAAELLAGAGAPKPFGREACSDNLVCEITQSHRACATVCTHKCERSIDVYGESLGHETLRLVDHLSFLDARAQLVGDT